MFVADMHCDSLIKVNENRALLTDYNTSERYAWLQLFAAFVPFSNTEPQERRRKLMQYANAYFCETERLGIQRIDDARSLIRATDEGQNCSIFAIEGGGGLFADSNELFTLYNMGLRVLGLAWDTNELACSATDESDTGLTQEGILLAKRCCELGITTDVSHLSDRSFYELLEVNPQPVIATHSNFRELCNHPRNLTLPMAKEIVARGGVIGLNLYPDFIKEGGACSADDVMRHIDFALENLGESALGFGLDIDGGRGKYPEGFDETSSIHDRLINLMLSHYPERVVNKIAGENVTDFFKSVL